MAKPEWTQGEANRRFGVTSLGSDECKPKYLYEKVYGARGDMETALTRPCGPSSPHRLAP